MALLEKQLYVKKSTIPNAGKGLFTKKFIPKGLPLEVLAGEQNRFLKSGSALQFRLIC